MLEQREPDRAGDHHRAERDQQDAQPAHEQSHLGASSVLTLLERAVATLPALLAREHPGSALTPDWQRVVIRLAGESHVTAVELLEPARLARAGG